jgi:hypothetical protein
MLRTELDSSNARAAALNSQLGDATSAARAAESRVRPSLTLVAGPSLIERVWISWHS